MSERLVSLGDVLEGFLAPLWLGSVIVGLALGALGYVAVYRGVVAYRRRFPLPARGASCDAPDPASAASKEPAPAPAARAARHAEAPPAL